MMIYCINSTLEQFKKLNALINQIMHIHKSNDLSATGVSLLQYLQRNHCIILDEAPKEKLHFFSREQLVQEAAKGKILAFDIEALEKQLAKEEDLLYETVLKEINISGNITSNITLGFLEKPNQASLSNTELDKILEEEIRGFEFR